MLQSTQLMVTVWLIGPTVLELTVLLMVTVQLTGCCTPRTDCPVNGDCVVDRTYSPRTDGDCAVDRMLHS